jgi:hypothetical protein
MSFAAWLSLPFLAPSIPPAQAPFEAARSAAPTVVDAAFRFGDFDGDGLDDVYVVDPLATDKLFKNTGAGVFEDVTAAHGLEGITGSRMALWFDFDGDHALDLYVANAEGRSRLFQNTGAGMFVDVTAVAGVQHGGGELFADVLDFDADARPDLHVVAEQGDLLFHNLGHGSFERVALPVMTTGSRLGSVPFAVDGPEPTGGAANDEEAPSVTRERALRRSLPALGTPASGSGLQGELDGSGASSGPLAIGNRCPQQIKDNATGTCMSASTTPTLGMLHPLSTNFNVGATGRVGVGTTTPEGRVHVLDGVAGTVTADSNSALVLEDSTRCYMSILTPDGDERGLLFGEPSSNSAGGIIYNNVATTDGLQFRTNGNLTRMAISSAGNVGIGTTNPSEKLAVAGGVNIDYAQANVGTLVSSLRFGDSTSGEGIASKKNAGGNQYGLDFYTGSQHRMAINSTGSVGVGTNAPGARLHVSGSDGSSGLAMQINNHVYVNSNTPFVGIGRSTPINGFDVFTIRSTLANDFGGMSLDTPPGGVPFYAYAVNGVQQGWTDMSPTSPEWRVAINGAYKLLVNNNGDGAFTGGLSTDIYGQNSGTLVNGLRLGGAGSGEGIASRRTAGTNQYGVDLYTGSAIRVSVTVGGKVGIGRVPNDSTGNALEVEGNASKTTATSWLANSDRRIKTDVHEIQGALDTLDRIRPVSFRYTDEYKTAHPSIEDKVYYNVIAQEFAEVFPEYVHASGDDGILQVDTYPALVHAVAAIQELHGVVEAQQQRIEQLERDQAREVAALEDRLARLESTLAESTAADR